MLTSAVELVSRTGLTVSVSHLSYEEVIEHADVARSAGYRVWPTKEAFFEDLLCELAGPKWEGTAAFDQKTLDLAILTVAARSHELVTAEGRLNAWLEASRVGAERNFQTLYEMPHWRTYVALTATVLSLPKSDLKDRLQARLKDSEATFSSAMADFYRQMSRLLGYRLRREFGEDYSILALLGAAVVEGLGLRRLISPVVANRTFRMYAFGQSSAEEWSLPSFGFTAILSATIEADPDYTDEDAARARLYLEEKTREIKGKAGSISEGDRPPSE